MPIESQTLPLAPSHTHPKSDEFAPTQKPKSKATHQAKPSKCLVYVLAGIVIQSAVILIFALIVLRPNTPDIKFTSLTARNLKHGNQTSPSLNATLVGEIAIKNTNFGYFELGNSTASFVYGNESIGDMKIGHVRAKARETKRIVGVSVELRSAGLSNTKNLSSDLNSGILKLSSYGKFSGRVHLLSFIKKKRTATLNCTMSLHLGTSMIQDLVCN